MLGSVQRLVQVQFLSLLMKAGCCFYHGVITTCNGFRYAMGAAILDKDHPEKVLYRTREYLIGPAAPYELQGDVPNVVFPLCCFAGW